MERLQVDLDKIRMLQGAFNAALNIPHIRGEIRAYNPVLTRWNYERCQTASEVSRFQKYERLQIETFLRERHEAAKNGFSYKSDNKGRIYNDLFPEEPFEDVLVRGIFYRQEQGSPEQEREHAELLGWQRVCEKLNDPKTPDGFKMVVISGPGIVNNTSYPDNYVDIYQVSVNRQTSKRNLKMTRFASSTSWEEYIRKATMCKLDYFENFSGPLDAWFLANPIYINSSVNKTATEIFGGLFDGQKQTLDEEDFQKILFACMPLIQHYLRILSEEKFSPVEIATSLNAVLNKSDLEKKALKNRQRSAIQTPIRYYSNIQEEAQHLGHQLVQALPRGCGISAGYDVNSGLISDSFSNSVVKFAFGKKNKEGEKWEYHAGYCVIPDCPQKGKKIDVGPCNICKQCEKKFN